MGKRRRDPPPEPSPAPLSQPFAGLEDLAADLPVAEEIPTPDPAPPGRDEGGDSRFRKRIVIQREKQGRGGKTVTVVRGVDTDGPSLDALARELRQTFGCGGHVAGHDIVLAGVHTDRVASWLKARGARRVIIGN
ncbi:MAG: translation initiation factor [Myxococcales bacterium FL481]|nr:MAG: translation initiation factor [Myxococcales bacterium FL481]